MHCLLLLQVFAMWHARKRADREAKRAADAEDRKKKVTVSTYRIHGSVWGGGGNDPRLKGGRGEDALMGGGGR
jgi:hypothetical protein